MPYAQSVNTYDTNVIKKTHYNKLNDPKGDLNKDVMHGQGTFHLPMHQA